MDMRKIFKPSYSFYGYGVAAFFIARDDNEQVLGRLATANNQRYNDFHKSKTAFFQKEIMDNLAMRIHKANKEIILIHGAGSYGHIIAKKYILS